jgi:hypothetical protein
MVFFFSVHYKDIQSKLTIPRFQNRGYFNKDYIPYAAKIVNGNWQFSVAKYKNDNYFFYIDNSELSNDNIFFLANQNQFLSKNKTFAQELLNFNKFTDTDPAFRANIEIFNLKGGFSSYQSDYPFDMILKKGNILSGLNLLTNKGFENIIIFKNIYYKPIREKFYLYFLDIKKQIILKKVDIYTNCTNFIELDNSFLDEDVYLFTSSYIGIPIFLSQSTKGELSMEHTHPPHLYVLGKKRFEIITRLKNEINKIIS